MSHAQLAAELVTSDQAARGAMALLSQAEAELQQVHAHAAAQVAASSQDGARQLEVIGARVEALALAMDGIATAAERLQVQIGNAERAEAQGRRRLIEEAVEAARTQLEEALSVATAEAQALDAEAAVVLKLERARGRIEAGLLAVDLACEERVVASQFAAAEARARAADSRDVVTRETFGLETTRSALHEEEESAAVASEASKARAKAVAAAALEARAAAEAAAEVRVREVTAAHAAALSEVRQQLDLAEQELAEERRCRRAIEQAAKQGAHEAMTEQARWRAAAAEGWLTAGREAKRRQAAQLARMSDMLQLGGSGGPLTERINGAEQPEAHGLGVESADGAGGGRAGLGAAWASPRASSPRASSPVPPAAEPDEAPWRESELIALQMLSGGSPSTTAAAYAPAAAAAGRSSLLSKHAIASPMGPARHAKPPARAATPKTRAAGAPPAPPAHVTDGRAVSFGGVPLSSSLRPPRVRYEDTVAADLD
ncbi:hypothetical protein Ctob_009206 [Chrysochromulina tobinii]|uniref:Uncharacterized protein n=1 Tax=Chrysochromulina tobinii TaxID=1460289 RepID=A0A0M0K575_9EUKA|nr:hypothetical protein Ctob_009206 [Chrysochromulina tobinii]|eukprot:KOO33960.1 hypothetical protein Ctob_009206 [Chrysochromulina sp. CCMP291]